MPDDQFCAEFGTAQSAELPETIHATGDHLRTARAVLRSLQRRDPPRLSYLGANVL